MKQNIHLGEQRTSVAPVLICRWIAGTKCNLKTLTASSGEGVTLKGRKKFNFLSFPLLFLYTFNKFIKVTLA